ncbi:MULTISPECIES: acyltransferase [Pseudomonas]|jgi:peptidoglycan/LPS O-acetylase OafA/YrhL|uniref:Acyltransferase n=1 Tax=Pseudomonas mandelii TaxID=75612 RepID=A0AB36D6E8_9PSED|nr:MULTISPECIES: acyltransferase [Pseudomonas]NMZ83070.1 acyltransferase [Pseudomonas mandelii]PMV85463.1 hypothetical protein C1X56_18995 [Pseudomonas sp. GW101-1A09]PMV97032.1 hypothetical protein C1X51_06330 [Pseudomonas sp. FW306-2-2C-B10A]PMV98296.1 hypothetical protein C1X55_15000 [Pseudomonas sp. GW460-C8]PMW05630.1 hypothetical protein C1X50_11900 [Pseudomonas sp. MPR-TSA4]
MSVFNSPTKLLTINNLDLIRLVAAFQVALKHALIHLEVDDYYIELVSVFPGVPIFFLLSGFLIYRSYANSGSMQTFFANRLLRIYPALVVCFVLSVVMLIWLGYLPLSTLITKDFVVWAVAQLTLFQFYNPDFLRGFGVGVVNGSLWTISLEMQFYFLTPLLFYVVRKSRSMWAVLMAFFVACQVLHPFVASDTLYYKLLMVSFFPWFCMFIFGAWMSTRDDLVKKIIDAPLWLFVVVYAVVDVICYWAGMRVVGNEINIISFLALSALVFKLAYTKPELSRKILGKNDISYGVYIYHMPIVNAFIFFGWIGTPYFVLAAMMATFLFAYLSWICIERPMLGLKKTTLRRFS